MDLCIACGLRGSYTCHSTHVRGQCVRWSSLSFLLQGTHGSGQPFRLTLYPLTDPSCWPWYFRSLSFPKSVMKTRENTQWLGPNHMIDKKNYPLELPGLPLVPWLGPRACINRSVFRDFKESHSNIYSEQILLANQLKIRLTLIHLTHFFSFQEYYLDSFMLGF